MEMSQGYSLCSILNKNVIFFFYKIREQEGKIGSAWGKGDGTSGRQGGGGERVCEGEYNANTVYACM
jgi:hypothetical protein